ncbi:MAG: FAD-binding oxidoreductase [Casimicrobiaceae bacterium]
MADSGATFHTRLAAVVGPTHVLTGPADTEPYLVDWRGRYRGAARAVVRPRTTEEVAAVVRVCAEAGVPIVPQGGNTGMCGGATPHAQGDEVVLALSRLNRVRTVDAANATITVEAGVTLRGVQEAAEDAGMYFPLSLGSEGSCTIGGNLSTNAGGTAVLRFGNARELALGLEVVLADGRVWDGLRGLRKDNTGYDLKQLFIGAEGTLGIVTAAVLKLFPAPTAHVTALAGVNGVEQAVKLLRVAKQTLGERLTGFELISDFAFGLSRTHHPDLPDPLPGHPWFVLLQVDAATDATALAAEVADALGRAVDAGAAQDAVVAQSQEQADRLWAVRENITEAQRREGPNIKHDISLSVSAIPAFVDSSVAALAQALPGARPLIFGHLGDGNLHYNLAAPVGVDAGAFMENAAVANRVVHDLVAAAGGSISAEHGIGQLKRDELTHYKSGIEIELMHRVKAALDPRGLLNPGKVL